MSSRALRKLQNDDELLESILRSNNSSASTSKKSTPKPHVNIFALMNDNEDDDEGSDNTSDIAEKEQIDNGVSETEAHEGEDGDKMVKLPTKSQKKKNKKKNKTSKKTTNIDTVTANEDENDEEFDKLLQQFQRENIRKNTANDFELGNVGAYDDEDEFFTASESEDIATVTLTERIENDLRKDNAFSRFPVSYFKYAKKFFNDDFKKLDPHSEFKLLFDDISAEALEDIDEMSSTSISPQQLKQIQRMKRLVRNWGGKDHKSVPNGPGSSLHRLQFTKVRNDWIPTQRGELTMKSLNLEELVDWQLWQRPIDWKDVIEEDVKRWKSKITFFKFEPLNDDINRKAITEFYLSVVLHPDHEALINLIASKYPYHVPGLLQVALITIRQGDKSNTNGLLQRALFVFDRALRSSINFDGTSCQLPYIYFYNRQFYLAIFRYILALAQRGAVATASEWCKVLWSLSPLEDPLGCRYFMDHYLLLNNDYQYLIELSKSPLMNTYKQWNTLGFSLGVVLSYLHLNEKDLARKELIKCFKNHPLKLAQLFQEKLLGDPSLIANMDISEQKADILESKAYMARFPILWKNAEDVSFLHSELTKILHDHKTGNLTVELDNNAEEDETEDITSPFFIEGIPINLLRFAILSEESSVMAAIPPSIWSDYEVFEFDVLPPTPTTKESIDVLETVKSYIHEKDLVTSQAALMQDEDILNQIRQLSLQQYIQENETENNQGA
ncbi:Rqc1p NDAI_0C04480 [Naumovozyma dairenensis CBS 421]|uniref:Ribosome quality control complex subunit 1 n=1 Tax=Naumovozyma dairenensis (strain ATCC 10597 / BCRC 20456 / CBS 421 / NBRC 0211 / NRRL Y-12639) TaxID=1071378 RepID=G0W8J7_NAUDC|nr:hypothetical protein NDAI_0C04480 [Naumovozyma dairenensis CBS 421]CCD24108.1 hypothetical protein NDAI_0C04480 [Naumovozyma dairenensis CBS 421]